MDKSLQVKFQTSADTTLIIKMLKLQDALIDQDLNKNAYPVKVGAYAATIYFEKEVTEEDRERAEKQITSLIQSIARRKALLSNPGYVSKAPANLVEQEKEKLKQEEEQLAELQNK